uniref:Uncharacterized protein n=1 Tax=Acrobeloides nanus TaxID=290746 RepID=A0A914CIG3_9BILA
MVQGVCSSHCTLNFDKTLLCWNRTLDFFEQVLLGQLKHYSVIQANRAKWMYNRKWDVNYTKMRDESIARLLSEPSIDIEDENGIDNSQLLQNVIGSLIDNTQELVNSNKQLNHSNPCPVACERDWDPFFLMFFISSAVNILLACLVLLFVWLLDRRDSKYSLMEDENEFVKLKKRKKQKKQPRANH